jgi:hypothetical protein
MLRLASLSVARSLLTIVVTAALTTPAIATTAQANASRATTATPLDIGPVVMREAARADVKPDDDASEVNQQGTSSADAPAASFEPIKPTCNTLATLVGAVTVAAACAKTNCPGPSGQTPNVTSDPGRVRLVAATPTTCKPKIYKLW